jgi:hypothetical protein
MNRRKTGEAETILSHLVQKGRKEKDEETRNPSSVSRE